MKKFLTLALVGAMVLGVSSVVYANICAFDPVPAATLLFPFVQYDYDNPSVNTLFAITNVSSEAQVVHVTLWTDYSVAILDFNILLTGYDVQTMAIRDILRDGDLPITYYTLNNAGPTPNDDGPVSSSNSLNADWTDNVLDPPEPTGVLECVEGLPEDYEGGIPEVFTNLFRDWLTRTQRGNNFYEDSCVVMPTTGGSVVLDEWFINDDFNANRPSWMYITVDVANQCNRAFPDEAGYFEQNASILENVLIGDLIYLDEANNFSEALNAVSIEADFDLQNVVTWAPFGGGLPQPIGFYSKFAPQRTTREPLPTAWAFRYVNAPAAQANTWIRAWKGSTDPFYGGVVADLGLAPYRDERASSFYASNCYAYTYYAWDEAEDVTSISDNPWSQPGVGTIIPNLLPLETQEVNVDEFTLPDAFGWMLFVWPASNFDMPFAPDTPDYYQTWMGTRIQYKGTFSAAKDAHVMANYNCFSDQVLPNLGVDYKYINPDHYYNISPMNAWTP